MPSLLRWLYAEAFEVELDGIRHGSRKSAETFFFWRGGAKTWSFKLSAAITDGSPRHQPSRQQINVMGKKKNTNRELTHEEIWDDSALVRSWDEAVEEYKVSRSLWASVRFT